MLRILSLFLNHVLSYKLVDIHDAVHLYEIWENTVTGIFINDIMQLVCGLMKVTTIKKNIVLNYVVESIG